MKEQVYNLDGIKLCSATNAKLNGFCLALYIKAGSIFEDSSNNGITHLFEHIVFRNLKRKYTDFYELLASHGIDFQGVTYKEFLRFSINGPSDEFEFATDVFCSLFDEIDVNSKELQNEKKRIKAEIREENPRETLDWFFNKIVWKDSEAEKSVLGYCKNLDGISLKRLNEFRKEILSKDNCLIYVTGNVAQENIEKLKQKIGDLDITDSKTPRSITVVPCDEFFNRNGEVKVKNGYWHYIQFGFDIDTLKYNNGVLDLIYAILFKGEKALLHKFLSEENPIIYSYDATLEHYDNVGNLNFLFEVDKNKIEEAIAAVLKLFCDVRAGRFNFEANLAYEIAAAKMDIDRPDSLNWNMAYYNHISKTKPLDYNEEFCGRFKITKDEVIAAAKEIFTYNNMTVAIKGDKRKINTQKIENILKNI